MASSESASLRLELMADGENSTTWGAKANTVFKQLEDAIAGTENIALSSSDVTLTDSQYTFGNQAGAMVLNLTGTLTANVNVIVPSRSKLFLVKNGTSGSYTVTVKTSAGTGVEVKQGTNKLVHCDGTNVGNGLSGDLTASAVTKGSWTISSTLTQATWASGDEDTDTIGMLDDANDRLVAPVGAELMLIQFSVSSGTAAGSLALRVRQDGFSAGGSSSPPKTWAATGTNDGNEYAASISFITDVTGGSTYFEFFGQVTTAVTSGYSISGVVLK